MQLIIIKYYIFNALVARLSTEFVAAHHFVNGISFAFSNASSISGTNSSIFFKFLLDLFHNLSLLIQLIQYIRIRYKCSTLSYDADNKFNNSIKFLSKSSLSVSKSSNSSVYGNNLTSSLTVISTWHKIIA